MNICRNCHFLSKYQRFEDGKTHSFPLNKDERSECVKSPNNLGEPYFVECHMMVWSEGVGLGKVSRDEIINKVNRKSCFFFPYHEGMLFPAAIELQKRKVENENLKKSNKYTRIGLYIAAGALLLSALNEFFKFINTKN
jgi:hypothetical protein